MTHWDDGYFMFLTGNGQEGQSPVDVGSADCPQLWIGWTPLGQSLPSSTEWLTGGRVGQVPPMDCGKGQDHKKMGDLLPREDCFIIVGVSFCLSRLEYGLFGDLVFGCCGGGCTGPPQRKSQRIPERIRNTCLPLINLGDSRIRPLALISISKWWCMWCHWEVVSQFCCYV